MKFKISFYVICLIIVISVCFTAFIAINSRNKVNYEHQFQDYNEDLYLYEKSSKTARNNQSTQKSMTSEQPDSPSSQAKSPKKSSAPVQSREYPSSTKESPKQTSSKQTSSKQASSKQTSSKQASSKVTGNSNNSNDKLSSSQMAYLNSYFTAYLNRYMKNLSKEMSEYLLENLDEYVQKYIEEYLKKYSSSNLSSENSSSLSSFSSTQNSSNQSSSNTTSDVTSDDNIPDPDPPPITDEFLRSEIERVSLEFAIKLEVVNPDDSNKLSNLEILTCVLNLETALIQMPNGLTDDFGLTDYTIISNESIFLFTRKSLPKKVIPITKNNDTSTIVGKMLDHCTKVISDSGIYVNLWQFNPPSFDETGPNPIYTYNINNPKRGYFVTFKAQSSEMDDLTQIFLELVNAQNRFTHITRECPVYYKIELACIELSKQYPSIKNTDTYKSFFPD